MHRPRAPSVVVCFNCIRARHATPRHTSMHRVKTRNVIAYAIGGEKLRTIQAGRRDRSRTLLPRRLRTYDPWLSLLPVRRWQLKLKPGAALSRRHRWRARRQPSVRPWPRVGTGERQLSPARLAKTRPRDPGQSRVAAASGVGVVWRYTGLCVPTVSIKTGITNLGDFRWGFSISTSGVRTRTRLTWRTKLKPIGTHGERGLCCVSVHGSQRLTFLNQSISAAVLVCIIALHACRSGRLKVVGQESLVLFSSVFYAKSRKRPLDYFTLTDQRGVRRTKQRRSYNV